MSFYAFWLIPCAFLAAIGVGILYFISKLDKSTKIRNNLISFALVLICFAIVGLVISPIVKKSIFDQYKYTQLYCVEIMGKYKIQRDWYDELDRIITEDDTRYIVNYPNEIDSLYLIKKVRKKWLGFVNSGKEDEMFTLPTSNQDKVRRMKFSSCNKQVELK